MTETERAPIEGPLVRLWIFIPLLLLMIAGAGLGAVVAHDEAPFAARAAAGAVAWLGPMAFLIALRPWMNRMDELQKRTVWQAASWAGFWGLFYIVGMSFYLTVIGSADSMLPLIGATPGGAAFAGALMIWMIERRTRALTAGARE